MKKIQLIILLGFYFLNKGFRISSSPEKRYDSSLAKIDYVALFAFIGLMLFELLRRVLVFAGIEKESSFVLAIICSAVIILGWLMFSFLFFNKKFNDYIDNEVARYSFLHKLGICLSVNLIGIVIQVISILLFIGFF